MPDKRSVLAAAAFVTAILAAASFSTAQSGGTTASGGLDAFMARVLEHRDEAWKKLHDYVLSETERFEITGPAGVRLQGMRHEFSWYVRDGYLIRSPIRFDGVTIPESERRKYEENWLKEEQSREAKRAERDAKRTAGEVGKADDSAVASDTSGSAPALQDIVGPGREPRFISEAFFLKFKFEPGNYYLAGREQLDGREVLRIEYYPTNLFGNHRDAHERARKESPEEAALKRKIERDLNKVALVTLWVDPVEYQVVRYKFDNVDFGFLPARWLVRVDSITASMTMGRVLDGVWLPRAMSVNAAITLASGNYGFSYGRELYDYKKAETGAKIRSIRGER